MKAQDLRAKSDDELKQELMVLRKEQLNLRFQKNGGQLEKTAGIRHVRRDIARIKTLLGERLSGNVANDVKKAAKPKKDKKVEKKAPAKKKAAAKSKKEDKGA